jgi:hypothetical protein
LPTRERKLKGATRDCINIVEQLVQNTGKQDLVPVEILVCMRMASLNVGCTLLDIGHNFAQMEQGVHGEFASLLIESANCGNLWVVLCPVFLFLESMVVWMAWEN